MNYYMSHKYSLHLKMIVLRALIQFLFEYTLSFHFWPSSIDHELVNCNRYDNGMLNPTPTPKHHNTVYKVVTAFNS